MRFLEILGDFRTVIVTKPVIIPNVNGREGTVQVK